MLKMWATVTTVINTALAVAGLGVAGYAVTAKPRFALFYYGVAFICVLGAGVGFVNLWFLNEAVRRKEEKDRPLREERERKKAERAAKKAEREAARAEKEAAKAAARAQEEAAAQAAETALLDQPEDQPEDTPEETTPTEPPPEDNGEVTVL